MFYNSLLLTLYCSRGCHLVGDRLPYIKSGAAVAALVVT